MTYKAMIINYVAPVRSPNLRDTNYRGIQYAQNETLNIKPCILLGAIYSIFYKMTNIHMPLGKHVN